MGGDSQRLQYQCCFCGFSIEPVPPDVGSLVYTTCTDGPVVNHVGADSETLSHLLNSQLLRPHEPGRGNLVAITDPLNHRTGKGFAQGADLAFLIEAIGDLLVGQALGEMPNAVHHRGGLAHAIRYIGPELHANVTAGAALPADVSQELLGMAYGPKTGSY
jgi:hypothetical protein